MKREIKFEYGFQSINGIIKKTYTLSEIPFIKEKCDLWDILPVVYVRQFTGLTDKNGKEIYEGDVLWLEGYILVRTTVVFKEGCFCCDEGTLRDVMTDTWFESFEVIGNIYEHPHLLEDGK